MNTNEINENLLAYLDGLLDEAGRREVEKALADDPQIVQRLDQLKTEQELLRRTPEVKAPRELWDRIASGLQPPRRIFKPVFLRTAALAVAACLVIALGLRLFSPIDKPQDPVKPDPPPEVTTLDFGNPPYVPLGIKDHEYLGGQYELALTDLVNGDIEKARKELRDLDQWLLEENKQLNGIWRSRFNELRIRMEAAQLQ